MTRPLRVLVVDDELLIADYVASVVEDAGHEVVGISMSVDDALRLLAAARPDVAILDIRLKGTRDGVDLAEAMRAEGFAVPHIFISGSGDPETLARANATAPLAFLQKPFDSTRLIAALSSVATLPTS